jgi:hypothetical protein
MNAHNLPERKSKEPSLAGHDESMFGQRIFPLVQPAYNIKKKWRYIIVNSRATNEEKNHSQ